MLLGLACLLGLGSLATPAAQAAQVATVVTPGAALLSTPNAGGQLVENLAQNAKISVSNQPTQGYYRARAASGNIGWVSANDVQVSGGAPDSGAQSAPPPPQRSYAPAPRTSSSGAANPNFIATSNFNLEASLGFSQQVGLGFGGGPFLRFGSQSHWEIGAQGFLYPFNAGSPLEIDGALRYWFGKDGLEMGIEAYGGMLLFGRSAYATALKLNSSYFVGGPGLHVGIRLGKGVRLYGGFREDLSDTHGRYFLSGLAFYI